MEGVKKTMSARKLNSLSTFCPESEHTSRDGATRRRRPQNSRQIRLQNQRLKKRYMTSLENNESNENVGKSCGVDTVLDTGRNLFLSVSRTSPAPTEQPHTTIIATSTKVSGWDRSRSFLVRHASRMLPGPLEDFVRAVAEGG